MTTINNVLNFIKIRYAVLTGKTVINVISLHNESLAYDVIYQVDNSSWERSKISLAVLYSSGLSPIEHLVKSQLNYKDQPVLVNVITNKKQIKKIVSGLIDKRAVNEH